ncbi:hypothetical protein IAT40_007550 [Kwoniella sp. CBS 6097]
MDSHGEHYEPELPRRLRSGVYAYKRTSVCTLLMDALIVPLRYNQDTEESIWKIPSQAATDVYQRSTHPARTDGPSGIDTGATAPEAVAEEYEAASTREIASIEQLRHTLRLDKMDHHLDRMEKFTQQLLAACEEIDTAHHSQHDPGFGDFNTSHPDDSGRLRVTSYRAETLLVTLPPPTVKNPPRQGQVSLAFLT